MSLKHLEISKSLTTPRCLLAGDSVLADLVSAIPKHLTRLGLAWGPNSLGGCLRKMVSQGYFPFPESEISRWEFLKIQLEKKKLPKLYWREISRRVSGYVLKRVTRSQASEQDVEHIGTFARRFSSHHFGLE